MKLFLALLLITVSLTEIRAERKVAVVYGEPKILKSQGWLGTIYLDSQVIFNASLAINGVETASCDRVLRCWLVSPSAFTKKNQYIVTIIAEDINHSDEVYFIVNYEWYLNRILWVDFLGLVGFFSVMISGFCFFGIFFLIAIRCSKCEKSHRSEKSQMIDMQKKNYQSIDRVSLTV